MSYIFINPVVAQLYDKDQLNLILLENGYQRVEVKEDWHRIVKEKYNDLVQRTGLTVLDRRCPKAIDILEIDLEAEELLIPTIEPILIHCAIELSEREDLKGIPKVVTTPCESLAQYGNKMALSDTTFISWKRFVGMIDSENKLKKKNMGVSPIPPGYFESINAKVSSLSDEANILRYFKDKSYKNVQLVEMLYCIDGCHNGDGIKFDD